MATVLDSLRAVNAYPIPLRTLVETAESRGLDPALEATQEVLRSPAYRLATADLLLWLSIAPDVSQGGIAYSFTDEQRKTLRVSASNIYNAYGEQVAEAKSIFGYKGERL